MSVLAIIVVVTTRRFSERYRADPPEDEAWFDHLEQELARFTPKQVLVTRPSPLQDTSSFSQRPASRRFRSRQGNMRYEYSWSYRWIYDRQTASLVNRVPSPSAFTNSMTPPLTPSHSPNCISAAYLR